MSSLSVGHGKPARGSWCFEGSGMNLFAGAYDSLPNGATVRRGCMSYLMGRMARSLLGAMSLVSLSACLTPPSSGASADQRSVPSMPVIQLEQTVYFPAPDGSHRTVPAGVYEVMTWEENRLVLLPQTQQEPVLIQAQTTEHQRALTGPIAAIVRDSSNEDLVHLLFLRTDHTGWDATGTLSGIQSRASSLPKASLAQVNAANTTAPTTYHPGGFAMLTQPSSSSSLKSTTPPTSSPPPHWVSNSSMPFNAIPFNVLIALYQAGQYQFVCRAFDNNGSHPGVVVNGRCLFTWAGQVWPKDTFDWLVGDRSTAQWPRLPLDGTLPRNAFVAGQEPGRLVYVCQAYIGSHEKAAGNGWVDEGTYLGKLVDRGCHFAFGGSEQIWEQRVAVLAIP